MKTQDSNSREKLGHLIMNVGGALPLLVGWLMIAGGLILIGVTASSRSSNSLIDPSGFGMFIGILALPPGIVILALLWLSRLGLRNRALTLVGSFGNVFVGLFLESPVSIGSPIGQSNLLILHFLALCFLISGLSALIGWWLQGVLSRGWVLGSFVLISAMGAWTLIQAVIAESGRQVLAGHTGSVYSVAWSPDGTHLISRGFDERVFVWDVAAGTPVLILNKTPGTLTDWSPDGKVVTITVSEGLLIRDAESGERLHQLELVSPDATLGGVSWSPDGQRLLAVFENALILWDLETGSGSKMAVSEEMLGFQWSSGGSVLWFEYALIFSRYEWALVLHDFESGDVLADVPQSNRPLVAALSPAGDFIMVQEDGFLSDEVRTAVVDVRTGARVLLNDVAGNLQMVKWSPDGSMIAGIENEVIKVWDAKSGDLVRSLKGHTLDVLDVEWSPDGGRLASASADQNVIVWVIPP